MEVCLDVAHDKVCEEVRQEHLVEECEGLHPEQLHRYHEGETRAAVASNLGTGGQNLHPVLTWDGQKSKNSNKRLDNTSNTVGPKNLY